MMNFATRTKLRSAVRLTAVGLSAAAAPADASAQLEPTPLRVARTSASAEFGGEYPGQAYWLSEDGNLALIYQWREDTDGDGDISVRLGHHGDMIDDEPRPYLVDTRSGETIRFDDFLATAAGRWIALREGTSVWLYDSRGGRRRLGEQDGIAAPDANECLGPRALVLDDNRIGVIPDEPTRFLIRSTEDDRVLREVAVDRDKRIWRAQFTQHDDVLLLYVIPASADGRDLTGGLPVQRTSCATRLGTMFAASYSSWGWDGPGFTPLVVGPNDERLAVDGEFTVLSDGIVMLADTALLRLDGTRVPLPPGCRSPVGGPGSRSVLIRCGSDSFVFDPVSGDTIGLPMHVGLPYDAFGITDEEGHTWIHAVLAEADRGSERIGRLRMDDGQLEWGEKVVEARVDGPWLVGRQGSEVHALEIATGRLVSWPVRGEWIYPGYPGTLHNDGQILVAAADRGVYVKAGESRTYNRDACFLEAAGIHKAARRAVEHGPWRLRCAVDDSVAE